MSNFFELANNVLSELGYAQKQDFTSFSTREEQEILRRLSALNTNVVLDCKINNRIRTATIVIPAGVSEMPDTIDGEIRVSTGGIIDIANKEKYSFIPQHEEFLLGNVSGAHYGLIGDKILFAPYDKERTLTVYYYSYFSCKDSLGNDKDNLTVSTDVSIIPPQLQTKILVNGTCYELKKRTDNTRIAYWKANYEEGKNQLRTFADSEDQTARFYIGRDYQTFVSNING